MRNNLQNVVVFIVIYLTIGTTSSSVFSPVTSNCSFAHEYECKDRSCIPISQLCDGKPQCNDRSDEEGCEECPVEDSFRCRDKSCISLHFKCDDYHNCPDGSDEKLCPAVDCIGKFRCGEGKCIPYDYMCNGEPDCQDNSDEFECGGNHSCTEFSCKNGHCIVELFKCDGDDDCGDNSDEENCHMPVTDICNLNNGLYACKDNSSCIQAEKVCDNTPDCSDRSDEGGSCKKVDDNCANANCSHGCVNTPDGPFCVCPMGYGRLSNTSCDDMDECHLFHGHCSQHCANLPGTYRCYCDDGYRLTNDGRTCVTKEGNALLVFAAGSDIRAYNLKSRKYFDVINDTKLAVGVAYDGTFVYWTEMYYGSESILRSSLDGSNKEVLVNTGLDSPEDIAVDWYTSNIYFVDSSLKHIGVCSNDGVHCSVLISKYMDRPRAIILNPVEGQMYWSDWGESPNIGRANMDGSMDISLVSKDIKWPNGLALDYPNDRLYWVDGKFMWIESVRLDGTHRQRILPNYIKHPYSLAVFEDKLYWSDWGTNSLYGCNKFSGKERVTLTSLRHKIHGISIYHPVMSKRKNHACDSQPCTHLCLLRGNNSYTCACPEGKELAYDRKSCTGHVKDSFLMVASGSDLITLHHQSLGRHNIFKNTFSKMDIDELVYDSLKNRAIVYDLTSSSIFAIEQFDKENPVVTKLAYRNIGRIEGMDIDYLTNTLYWCDTYYKTVEVMSLSTLNRAVVIQGMNGDTFIDIALIPELGIMYVAVRTENLNIHISRMSMDGKGIPLHIIEHGIKGPLVKMQYDPKTYQIYIADAGGHKIETLHVEGEERQGYREHFSAASITILGQDVFWTSTHSNKLYWSKQGEVDKSIKSNRLDMLNSVKIMHVAAVEYRKNSIMHICANEKNACSHICVQRQTHTVLRPSDVIGMAYTCLCPEKMAMSMDRKTCEPEIECSYDLFKCRKSNICIAKSRLCDGKSDCLNGEDEEGCAGHAPMCHKEQFQCADGQCISHKNRCDKHDDCMDKSDEANCESYDPNQRCKPKQFECNSGMCLDEAYVCDGISDCPDYDDENNCEKNRCKNDEFQCHRGNCIPKNWECDKSPDCVDGSDEHNNCTYNLPCVAGMYRCRSGGCIDVKLLCNKMDDCTDGSDELNCRYPEEEVKCKENEFLCDSELKLCLPLSAKCNGTVECPDQEDELGCNTDLKCNHHEWKCRTGDRCIPQSWKCDKFNDCSDGSDELQENCNDAPKSTSMDVPVLTKEEQVECDGGYHCKSGQCIDFSDVCNNFENCYDGSDENGLCDHSCKSNLCEGSCIKTPQGGMCNCSNGKILASDGTSCKPPPPPCQSHPSPCDHICTDTISSYFCSCFEGYSLRKDKKSCKADGERMSIFYIVGEELRMISVLNASLKIIHKENSPPLSGLDVYSKKQLAFFSVEALGEVHSVNYITYEEKIIYKMLNPTLLSVDWVTGNLYIVTNRSSITVCQMDMEKCSRLTTFRRGTIYAMAVDPINRIMYCSLTIWLPMNDAYSEIYKINLDGTHEKMFVQEKLSLCKGLVVDYERKLLYMSDKLGNKIESINYEGSHRRLVFPDDVHIKRPVDLDMFEDTMYYMVGSTKILARCKITAGHMCSTVSTNAYGIEHFTIGQSNKQKNVPNECAAVNCTHVCVLAPNGPKCLCPNGEPIAEGLLCSEDELHNVLEFETKNAITYNVKKAGANKGIAAIAIVFSVAFLFSGIYLLYKYQRRTISKTPNPNLSVHFQNPTFAGDVPNFGMSLGSITSKFPSLLRINQNEYVNPLNSKLVPNHWPPSTVSIDKIKKPSVNQLEAPKLLADSDSDVESERDFHDADKTRLLP